MQISMKFINIFTLFQFGQEFGFEINYVSINVDWSDLLTGEA